MLVHDKSAKDDPVYGKAIAETIKWFHEQAKERAKKLKDELRTLKNKAKKLQGEAKTRADAQITRKAQVDFGVLAIEVPTGEALPKLIAPKPNAPTLLPAYLNLWVQTSPSPSQLPDVSLWLHGPSSGPADVQVVWRADLTEDSLQRGDIEAATAIVAAVRPSSLEAISLPFVTARTWLASQSTGDLGDTEGATPDDSDEPVNVGRRALRWKGDESEIVDAKSLKPGHTIVVPATYGGIRRGCFDPSSTEPVSDRAEQAGLFARARPVLRLHPVVVEKLGLSLSCDEPDEAKAALGRLSTSDDWPAWKRLWAERLAKGRGLFVVPGEPPWTVLEAKRVPIADLRHVLPPGETFEDGVELTTDGDDSFCAGRSVSLSEHSADVEEFARQYATRCGLSAWLAEHIALAAWLHDVGKADRRFQLMLRGGSEIEFFKDETPWAKSAIPPGAREQRRIARLRSGYPGGGYLHAVQSVAMLQGQPDDLKKCLQKVGTVEQPDLDLVFHLVASHHGECRPLAPTLIDDSPVDVSLDGHQSKKFGKIDFVATTSKNDLHRLDSPLADRFWRLVAKYGWQELCWLEAILRLADHRASEEEQAKEVSL